ncbi:uncharacterized protein LOC127872054 [Dreissena polymorpha]|uniref:uncharacterized protein LOC127872054 n=1 Tax=Dreissena polymorpha TaxID=45954 RepID=UPI002263ECEC|nr:uncharacterized protein LOC127872054 [Dreissena polymorpha]
MCGQTARQQQRTDVMSGETVEDPSQEQTHSTGDLLAADMLDTNTLRSGTDAQEVFDDEDPLLALLRTQSDPEANTDLSHSTTAHKGDESPRKPRISWPKTSDKKAWKDLDDDLHAILETALQGAVERKLVALTNLVYTVGKERFGLTIQKTTKKPVRMNRRQRQIKGIRSELKVLRRRYRHAREEEKPGLKQLRDSQREQLLNLCKAEQLREKRRKKAKRLAEFIANPFKFSNNLLDKEKSGKLESSMEEITQFLTETHSDDIRDVPLGNCQRIEPVPEPTTPLDTKEPTLKEVSEVVQKARAGSAPGPNGIPYKVYKMCPKLLRRLWNLLKVVWRKGRRPRFSRCVEHTSALSQIIREAKVNQKDLTVVWLDIANAYGSIPHKLIETALKHYHIPDHVQQIINEYFSNIQLRFAVGEQSTPWIRLEKGIVTGCTISVVLFVMGMNLIINAAKRETKGPKTTSGIYLPSNRGFMDDLTVTTATHVQARWVLRALNETVTWARMKFKPKKSRSLVIKKGKVTQRFTLQVQSEDIPSIVDNPIKCLGKWYDASLNDTSSTNRTKNQLQEGLKQIDQTSLPGKFKAWLYQHGLLPRLMWPLMLYEIAVSTVEGFESTINRYLRRWLGVPPSFTSIGLYGRTNQLQLPISSVVEEYKVAKARMVVTLKESSDDLIRMAGIETRTGRKWSASQAVSQAESILRHKDIVGTTTEGRQGLGMIKPQRWSTADKRERSQMVQKEIRASEEESRRARSVEMGGQCAWNKWTTTERKFTWADIWQYEPLRLKFLLRSVYDLLPSPTNLHRWGLVEDPSCSLCNKPGTMEHILSSCQTSLTQGRYRWRHDAVLRELADVLERERRKKRTAKKTASTKINFVKAGETTTKQAPRNTSILDESDQWEMKVDLGKKLVFPEIV